MNIISEKSDLISKASQFKTVKKLPEALICLEKAKDYLSKITDDSKDSALKKGDDLYNSINEVLSRNNIKIQNGIMFDSSDLESHLSSKDILFKNKVWVKELCRDCDSKGIVKCADCKGDGAHRVECVRCSGKGETPCSVCHGNGKKVCQNCQGNGVFTCDNCSGTGTAVCGRCNGRGVDDQGCSMCGGRKSRNGSGFVTKKIQTRDNWGNMIWTDIQETCPKCQGKGRVDDTCNDCNGAGKLQCDKCGGSGQIQCRHCLGNGKIYCNPFNKCESCYGLGYIENPCPACKGRKGLKCKSCDGKGYIGEAEKVKIITPEMIK